MGAPDTRADCTCEDSASRRCDARLPDNPACAIHYHFGMLLGVDDFRTEQGFHVGRLRRHQRALHGAGVVHGFAVTFDPALAEVRVGAGYAIDPHGRDLDMPADQCLGLPAWWLKHRLDDDFAGVADPDDVRFDADVQLCYTGCLSRPVPAIADLCAGGSADIAYSRICESSLLKLVVRRRDTVAAPAPGYHLLRVLLGLERARADDANDAWLLAELAALAALPDAARPAAGATLWQHAAARAAAATAPGDGQDDCLTIASLTGIHIFLDHADPAQDVWRATVDAIDIDERATLLPTRVLQDAWQTWPGSLTRAAGAGPRVQAAGRIDTAITLVFDQPLAPASVTAAAFGVTAFDASAGWTTLTFADPPGYDDGARTVTLTLDAVPTATRIRITVHGSGATPLLGADFTPAGARTSDSDGSDLSTTIAGE
jgi:hypothetical protein